MDRIYHYRSKLAFGILVGLAAVGVVAFLFRYEPPTKYPLEFTAQQNVLREPAVFHLNEPVDVEATFRNTAEFDVTITAYVYWTLVTPAEVSPYYSDPLQIFNKQFKPGCVEVAFNNNPPLEVIKITKDLFKEGLNKVTWKLTGANTIITPPEAGQKEFMVDEFSYVPDNIPLPKTEIKSAGQSCEDL